jgi:hypothetical protein
VFLTSDPSETVREEIMSKFEKANLPFRLFLHRNDLNPFVSETQLRMEMTSIYPVGVIIYSQVAGDYQKNLKKIMTQKIQTLYDNANITMADANHSEINEDRLINEDQSFDDLHGYETVNRPPKNSQFSHKARISLMLLFLTNR